MSQAQTPPLVLVWLVFLITQGILCLAPWVSPPAGQPPKGADLLAVVLPAIALIDYALSFVLPRAVLFRAAKQLGPDFGTQGPSDAEVMRVAMPALFIQYALLEFVTLLGLVHSLVQQDPRAGLPYAALGILGTLLARPTPERLRRWIRRRPTP